MITIRSLSFAYLRHQAFGTLLHVLTLASGVAIIVALLLVRSEVQQQFSRNLSPVDLVVGAKGSPLQLILSSVLHIDVPTGNVPFSALHELEKNPLVKSVIPVALGDNYQGFRIVGTMPSYAALYGATLGDGRLFDSSMEAVMGADVAAQTSFRLGDHFSGSHGLTMDGEVHAVPYTIVGVLRPTHTVLDRLILTPVESVWNVHAHDEDEVDAGKKEFTSLLVTYKSPLAATTLPRLINSQTLMQAASPAFEVARLMRFMGMGSGTLNALGGWFVVLAVGGIFAALYRAVQERSYDLALLRSLGSTPSRVCRLIVAESVMLTLAGTCLGILLGHVFVWLMQSAMPGALSISALVMVREEVILLLAAPMVAVVAALIPAWRVYRMDVVRLLGW